MPQKLVAVAAEVYNPVTIKQLNEIFVSQKGETFVKRAIERLEKMNLVHSKGNKVYPVVTLLPPPKEKGEKEEKTMMTEFDKDVMLFMRKIQELYIEKTVEASISKKGKKHVKNTVLWMNKVLKQKFDGTLS
ncbi:MAG: hypothetical protein GWN31_03990, partial [Candidatus Thorarchaeota archaeon]|nr:hypothetical protein [Candidatus Thorarchaeota archaeon]NIW13094.1 hypothetical protein [Candidatus Thorarchaeota archaeon]